MALQSSPTKSTDGYSPDIGCNDFLVEGEITVTITLNEYRALIEHKAQSEAKRELETAKNNWIKSMTDAETLKKSNADLMAENMRLHALINERQLVSDLNNQ